jgi:uncharacterized OsmC-like protein
MATQSRNKTADLVVHGDAGSFKQEIIAGKHRLLADEPVSAGGSDVGPDPYDYLLAALGVCTSMTVGLYARRKNLPLEVIKVSLWHSRIYAKDCEECETKEGMLDRIDVEVDLTGALSAEQRDKLMEIAPKCPVKTIGDAYMAAGGVPASSRRHPFDACLAALAMQSTVAQMRIRCERARLPALELRMGIHMGPVISGVVGRRKFTFDIWGEAVNTAALMEASGSPGRINVSETVAGHVKTLFDLEPRGVIEANTIAGSKCYF